MVAIVDMAAPWRQSLRAKDGAAGAPVGMMAGPRMASGVVAWPWSSPSLLGGPSVVIAIVAITSALLRGHRRLVAIIIVAILGEGAAGARQQGEGKGRR